MMLERGSCASGDVDWGEVVGVACVCGAGMAEEASEDWALSVEVGGLAVLLV